MTVKKSTTQALADVANLMDQLELFLEPKIEESSQKGPDETGYNGLLQSQGLRYDAGKNRLDLIPPEWTWELGRVCTSGTKKYEARNWELGMDWSKVIGPLKRHLNRFERGERIDEETKNHHLALVAWNALALMSYDLRGIGNDNLHRKDYSLK